MFVYYFAHLPGSVEMWKRGIDVERGRLSGLLQSATRATSHQTLANRSEVSLGDGQSLEHGWLAPIELRVPGLFEDMIGDLRLDPIDIVTTRITLRASYAPASGPRDDAHRLVETLVKEFIDSLVILTVEPDGHST